MQNKANLLDAQMNVTSFHTVVYENKSNWKLGENKPNTNPIKPNFRKAKMNIALYPETNYERKGLYGCRKNKAKQTQFQKPLGSSEVRKARTGPSILSITPVKRKTSKTTTQTFVHLPETAGFIPGMIQGQILLPSKGGIGSRLITASIALIKKMLVKINPMLQ